MFAHPNIVLVNSTGHGEHHADGRVSDFLGPVVRHVGDSDTTLAGKTIVDIVETNSQRTINRNARAFRSIDATSRCCGTS